MHSWEQSLLSYFSFLLALFIFFLCRRRDSKGVNTAYRNDEAGKDLYGMPLLTFHSSEGSLNSDTPSIPYPGSSEEEGMLWNTVALSVKDEEDGAHTLIDIQPPLSECS